MSSRLNMYVTTMFIVVSTKVWCPTGQSQIYYFDLIIAMLDMCHYKTNYFFINHPVGTASSKVEYLTHTHKTEPFNHF